MNVNNNINPLQYAILQAAKVGNIKLMREFIGIGADPFAPDETGTTAIDYAKLVDSVKVDELLLELELSRDKL